jgi:hypothetical protein
MYFFHQPLNHPRAQAEHVEFGELQSLGATPIHNIQHFPHQPFALNAALVSLKDIQSPEGEENFDLHAHAGARSSQHESSQGLIEFTAEEHNAHLLFLCHGRTS